jgi:zinc transporter
MKSWRISVESGGNVIEGEPTEGDGGPRDGALVWIQIDGRNPAYLDWLHERSGLSAPVVSALTAVETRPRCEQIGEGALINLRGLGETPEDDPDSLVSIRLWAERGRVISMGYRRLAAMPALRAKVLAGHIGDAGDLVSALAMAITETLDEAIASLGDDLDECETTLDAKRAFVMRRQIAQTRSEAIQYRRFVVPQRQALERMAALPVAWLEDDDRLHLREAADRFARMAEELEASRERAALMHEQLTDLRAEQLETRTLTISIVALVFLPLTFLTGLLGMNVEGIPFADAPWAFWGVVSVCVAAAALIAGYFVRAHWFRG